MTINKEENEILNAYRQPQVKDSLQDAYKWIRDLENTKDKSILEYMKLVNIHHNGINFYLDDDKYQESPLKTDSNTYQALVVLKEAISKYPDVQLLKAIESGLEEEYYDAKVQYVQNLYKDYQNHIYKEMKHIMDYDEVIDFSKYGSTRNDQIIYLSSFPTEMQGKNFDLQVLAQKNDAVNIMLDMCNRALPAKDIVEKLKQLHANDNETAKVIKSDRGMGAAIFNLVVDALAFVFNVNVNKVNAFKDSIKSFKSQGAETLESTLDKLNSTSNKM